ncbi:MAG: AAA family ATPase, partial [Epsilonproteobacteria bacterium]|nr:AAA family ATPase [Campylobacterota bacterium]
MIERFYLKNYLTFKEAVLEFQKGLIVFSGPSGSGKSILMNAILSSFGFSNSEASLAESSVTWQIDPRYGIENDEINVFKQVRKEKSRYFINNQTVSKKNIAMIASSHLRHLSLKDYSDFENDNLLNILDNKIANHSSKITHIKKELQQTYQNFIHKQKELQNILDEQKRV